MKIKIFLLVFCGLLIFPFLFSSAQTATQTPAQTNPTNALEYSCKATNPDCKVGGLVFDPTNKDDVECACCGNCKLASFTNAAVQVVKVLLGLVGSLALAMFVYGGVMWIFSGGDPGRVEKGRKILTGAVIGVIIVLGAYTLINFAVQALTGKDINQLQEWSSQSSATPAPATKTN